MKTDVKVEHQHKSIDWDHPPLYWTDGHNVVYVLAVTDVQAKGDIKYYQAFSLNHGERWHNEYLRPKKAVEGLDPFYGTVTITQND